MRNNQFLTSFFFRKGILLGRRHFLVILFDLLYLNGECLMRKPLNERKRLLSLNFKEISNYVQISSVNVLDLRNPTCYTSLETFRQLYLECLDRREEGLIIKNADSFYIPGDRSNWWKLKKDYIEGYGDTADFAIVAAIKNKGIYDSFVAACLTNKKDLENDPCALPSFQAIFTVSLGLTRQEMDLLQAILEARKELNSFKLEYDCKFAKGFRVDEFGLCWLKEPLVFELLGSGFIRVTTGRGLNFYFLGKRNVVLFFKISEDKKNKNESKFHGLFNISRTSRNGKIINFYETTRVDNRCYP